MTGISAILFPFILTFIIPGIGIALLITRRQTIDLLLFIIYAAVCGFGFQISIGIFSGFFFFLSSNPAVRILIIALCNIGFITYKLLRAKKEGLITHITISAYDILALLVAFLIGILLHGTMSNLPNPYFNSGSDQYYWLAYAQRVAYEPQMILSLILRDPIYQAMFFLILAPYAAFLPKDFTAYQTLMELWPYTTYFLTACAMTRLAYETLPIRTIGIFSPIAFYLLHWGNYYAISTDVVPQNIGIFFLIAGFILLNKKMSGVMGIGFIALFYAIHTATCTMFILAVGTAKIAHEGIRAIAMRIQKNPYISEWHIFEKISFIPTFIVIILYGLYAAQILDYRPLETIGYMYEYEKKLTIWDQPYMDTAQNTVIWLAITGFALIPIIAYFDTRRRRLFLAIGFGFLLPWLFLKTPLVAYHAFLASWQSFRYYLVMYPSISILCIIPLAFAVFLIARFISKNLAAGIIALIIILNIPAMLKNIALQQELVALDMITGRDGGLYMQSQINQIKEFSAINATFPEGAVISVGATPNPYAVWVVAPRPWFIAQPGCTARSCTSYDMFAHNEKPLWDVQPKGLGLIEKGIVGEAETRALFETFFSTWNETEKHIIYHNPV